MAVCVACVYACVRGAKVRLLEACNPLVSLAVGGGGAMWAVAELVDAETYESLSEYWTHTTVRTRPQRIPLETCYRSILKYC